MALNTFEILIDIGTAGDLSEVFGKLDKNLLLLQKKMNISVVCRDTSIKLSGEEKDVKNGEKVINELITMQKNKTPITDQSIDYLMVMVQQGDVEKINLLSKECVCITATGKPIRPKTLGQKAYLDAILKNTIVLGVGPAGTGKTYLAVAMAVKAFRSQEITRIVLTRPAVEAGEKLGFLPGDLQTKVDPYLRPLYDALFDMLGADAFARQVERGAIEVAPLAYMRGRTLDDSFIILDEAQNTTCEQMKMFLTRLGNNSKAVITGDITQIDLPDVRKSGLIDACRVLEDVEDIKTIYLDERDVVRNRLVGEIIMAYNRSDAKKVHKESDGAVGRSQ